MLPSAKWPWQSTITKTATGTFSSEVGIFNNGHLEIMATYPKNNNPYTSAFFYIISKLLFMFCSWITSSTSLDMRFLLGGLHVLETSLVNSSIFLNIGFWWILKERPSEIIRSAVAIVRQVSLEVFHFWEFPSIQKQFNHLKNFLSYSQLLYLMHNLSLIFKIN